MTNKSQSGPVAIVAGRGSLPGLLTRELRAVGREVIWAVMEGVDADKPENTDVIDFRVEKLGALFKALRARGVRELCFAGGVGRPRLDPRAFDFKTMTLAPKFLPALRGGDDGTLRMVVSIFEGEGFKVRGAHELAPALLPGAGVLTAVQPTDADRADATRAAHIVRTLGAVDVGQGAVVAQGIALAVETAPGTDRMLDLVAREAGGFRPDPDGAKGVFFKAPKPTQDRRMDLPAIGPDTVTAVAHAGLAGIAVAEGGVMLLERERLIRAADEAGIFVWVRSEDDQ